MRSKPEKWCVAEAQPGIATFNRNHVFFGLGEAREVVSTEVGPEVAVIVPNVPDRGLRRLIAYAAVDANHTFYKAQRVMSYTVMEAMAQRFVDLGYTIEAWCDGWGAMCVKFAAQAENIFVSPLTFNYGDDRSRKYSKMAQALDAWRVRFQPGPALLGDNASDDYGWPAPQLYDDKPGTSNMVAWMRSPIFRGYSRLAAKHGLWLKVRVCPRCGTHCELAIRPECPKCGRPTQLEPLQGDFRLSGMRDIGTTASTQDDAVWVECHPEHHQCVLWEPQRYEDNDNPAVTGPHYEWVPVGDGCSSYADGEAALTELRAHYWESIKTITPAAAATSTVVTTLGGDNVMPFPTPTENTSIDNESGNLPATEVQTESETETDTDETDAEIGTYDETAEEDPEQDLRPPPRGYESWMAVQADYEIYGPRYDWDEAPNAVRLWLSGDREEDEDYFKSLEKIGAENIGRLQALVEEHGGKVIADALWALADDPPVFKALKEMVDLFVAEQYEVDDIEELKKEHDIFRDANRELHKANQALKDEIARLKGDKR